MPSWSLFAFSMKFRIVSPTSTCGQYGSNRLRQFIPSMILSQRSPLSRTVISMSPDETRTRNLLLYKRGALSSELRGTGRERLRRGYGLASLGRLFEGQAKRLLRPWRKASLLLHAVAWRTFWFHPSWEYQSALLHRETCARPRTCIHLYAR